MKVTDKDMELLNSLERLIKADLLSFRVDIVPKKGDFTNGSWDVSKTYIKIYNKYIELEEGIVNLVEDEHKYYR